jgi:hypothetical protein
MHFIATLLSKCFNFQSGLQKKGCHKSIRFFEHPEAVSKAPSAIPCPALAGFFRFVLVCKSPLGDLGVNEKVICF